MNENKDNGIDRMRPKVLAKLAAEGIDINDQEAAKRVLSKTVAPEAVIACYERIIEEINKND